MDDLQSHYYTWATERFNFFSLCDFLKTGKPPVLEKRNGGEKIKSLVAQGKSRMQFLQDEEKSLISDYNQINSIQMY